MNWLKKLGRSFSSRKLWITLLMGFSSGFPILLTGSVLKTWLAREQLSISTIGYFGWVGMAYSLKFLWAPFLDRYKLFFFGRRRSWILLCQISISILLFHLSRLSPQENLSTIAIVAVIIAFFGATQDIAIDAYRREILEDNEMGIGSTLTQYGYRLAMWLTAGLGVSLVGAGSLNLSWNDLYVINAVVMLSTVGITFLAPEPKDDEKNTPSTLKEAVFEPFREFFKRDQSLAILSFVFLFKLGDALSASNLNPFYVQMGYSNAEIGMMTKTVGLICVLFGLFIGGLIIFKVGVQKSLWVFGILQALSTAGFSIITYTGPQLWSLAMAIVFEDISSGMGSAAFIAYLATITNKKFTGTQFALLSALATSGRNVFSGFTGVMIEKLGWAPFYWVCAAIAIPGLVMLWYIQKTQSSKS